MNKQIPQDTISSVTNNIVDPIYVNISWNDFEKYIDNFLDDNPNLKYDYIFAIPRGGLVIGTVLSYLTNTKLLTTVSELKKIKRSRILIVDDILDSGDTMLNLIRKVKLDIYNVSIMSLVYKSKSSRIKPNYYCILADENLSYNDYNRLWFNFPWEVKNN